MIDACERRARSSTTLFSSSAGQPTRSRTRRDSARFGHTCAPRTASVRSRHAVGRPPLALSAALVLLGDLLRFLRNYDTPDKRFCRQLAEWKVLNNHLLPMFATYRHEPRLVEAIGACFAPLG